MEVQKRGEDRERIFNPWDRNFIPRRENRHERTSEGSVLDYKTFEAEHVAVSCKIRLHTNSTKKTFRTNVRRTLARKIHLGSPQWRIFAEQCLYSAEKHIEEKLEV
jgi:hypothetical protein